MRIPFLRSALVILAAPWIGACSGSTASDTSQGADPDPEDRMISPRSVEEPPNNPNAAVIVGCRDSTLGLGQVDDPDTASPQVVWNGNDFAVGWTAPEGYRVLFTNGHGISNSLTLPEMPITVPPRLVWTGTGLELYYALSETVFVDQLEANPQLAVIATRAAGIGSFFDVAVVGEGRVALLTPNEFRIGGEVFGDAQLAGGPRGPFGWNGRDFLIASVLGHGEWHLLGLSSSGTSQPPAIDRHWCGVCAPGPGPGIAFASSPSAGRHAVAMPGSSIAIALEGAPIVERELGSAKAQVSMFWDGRRYVVLLAHDTSGGGERDIALLAVPPNDPLVARERPLIPISPGAGDDQLPVGAAAGAGDYGIAWVRGSELVFQRCALTER